MIGKKCVEFGFVSKTDRLNKTKHSGPKAEGPDAVNYKFLK